MIAMTALRRTLACDSLLEGVFGNSLKLWWPTSRPNQNVTPKFICYNEFSSSAQFVNQIRRTRLFRLHVNSRDIGRVSSGTFFERHQQCRRQIGRQTDRSRSMCRTSPMNNAPTMSVYSMNNINVEHSMNIVHFERPAPDP